MLTREARSAHRPYTPTELVRGRVRACVFVCHMRAYDNSLSCWVFHLGCEEGAKKTTVVIKPCFLLNLSPRYGGKQVKHGNSKDYTG